MNILVINCGSSSVKHQLIDCLQEVTVAEGVTELSANVDAAVAVKQLLKKSKMKLSMQWVIGLFTAAILFEMPY